MDTHSLKVLEYQKVIDRLASHTSNGLGREAAIALVPSPFAEEVSRRLQETREARHLLDTDSGMPLGGIHDIREPVARAAVDYQLTPHELLEIASTAGAGRRLKAYLVKRAADCPLLAEVGGNLPVLQNIEKRIEESIADNAEVRDSASPELARVRGQLKVVQARLRDRLNNLLASDKYRAFIQEPVITIREGRYCIPVKAEYRAQLGGIVHDASASGATVFIEPGATVELGNEAKELAIKEEQEVYRILSKITELVGKEAASLRLTIEILGQLDMANAKALMSEEMQASDPRINRNGTTRLKSARHPLLPGTVVPVDVEVGERFTILLITGPNTGGKTVTLKTVGLLTLMAQSGLQIPASADSEIGLFSQVWADIGDEQDIQQSLSTFSAHLKNITRIIQSVANSDSKSRSKSDSASHPEYSLVLLDEIGAGTDPAEGAALAKALLKRLQDSGARVIATTHYGELKEYAYSHAGVENASVEFDRETLRPTYRVLLGVPGSSNAFYIAGRLGLPDDIIENARGLLSTREQATAELLQQIEESRRKTFEMERDAARAKQAADTARDDYETRVREVTDVQRTVRRQAEDEARAIIRRASDRAENILDELRKMNKGARKGSTARRRLTDLRREVSGELSVSERDAIEPLPVEGHEFHRGDKVRVITLGLDGELLSDPADGTVTVQMGVLRATLPLDVLRPLPKVAEPVGARRSGSSEVSMRKALFISPELMLRAMRVDEAAPMLDKYVDDAYAAGISQARIIHGRGTGALRKFVWDYLKSSPVVKSYRLGEEGEGGDGATVVTFKE